MQTKESAHPADLWSFEFHWIDVALPQEAQALAYDSSAQALLDGLILKIIKSADADAAKAMCALSLGLVAAQSTLAARVFWKICAAYFEALALGLCPLDVYAKRAASQILLAFRTLARGAPDISERLVHDLLFFCAQAVPKRATDAPLLTAVRSAYGLTQADSFLEPPQVNLIGSDPEEQVKVIGSLRIDISLYNVFLNAADEWSRRLLTELGEWALELHRPIFESTVGLARSLADSAATVGFKTLSEMARSLEQALQLVQLQAPGLPEHAKVFVDAAEDIRRLLHQFAAGFLKAPDQTLLDALKAIGTIEFPVFEKEALELLPQLGAALRQWTARPENLGARNEVLRVLRAFKGRARLADATHLDAMAQQMEAAIEQIETGSLQAAQLEPLLSRFDALQTSFDKLRADPSKAPLSQGGPVVVPLGLQTFLALDFGLKRTGFAVGNRLLRSAQPQGTITAEGDLRFTKIAEQLREWQPDALVVGVPFHPDGAAHENTLRARRFARQLQGRFKLPVFEVDERYSTTEALALGAKDADAAAACIILEQFLRSIA